MQNYIFGNIRKIVFESDASFYKVGILKLRETNIEGMEDFVNKTITFTGSFNEINKEVDYIMYGELVEHYRYGYQFNVTSYEIKTPSDLEGLVMYLSSGIFSGIGIKTAKKIVDKFKEETIEIIKNNYRELIPIINEKKARNLYIKLREYEEDQNNIIMLNALGFSTKESLSIINKYKLNLSSIVENNIYLLQEMVNFLKLDSIFLKNNVSNSEIRIKEVIKYIIREICFKNGDTLIETEELFLNVKRYLKDDIDLNIFLNYIRELIKNGEVKKFDNFLMLKDFYDIETSIANKVKLFSRIKSTFSKSKIVEEIKKYEKENKILLGEEQKKAIIGSLNNNIFIISGGPGTGKTTIIKALVDIYLAMSGSVKEDIALLAPTGRSARRISESVMHTASTIHKFLKWNKDLMQFQVNENFKSEVKFVVVDEFSMVDIFLFASLLDGLKDYVKIILVGDSNQLPSISPGNLLADMIKSPKIEKQFLNHIYRVKEGSFIIDFANKIYKEEVIEVLENNLDFTFVCSSDIEVKENLKKECLKSMKNKIDLNDFQVLAPMYKGENGIDNLNILMQSIFNPEKENKKEVIYAQTVYRENDKVIQLVNDVDNNVYNGDIGFIKDIKEDGKTSSMIIDFGGNKVELFSRDYDKISLAYAVSIHKSQGSEYDNVVIVLSKSFKRMLYNKLIYTAVTRAKKHLVLIATIEDLNYAIKSLYATNRKTRLNHFIDV